MRLKTFIFLCLACGLGANSYADNSIYKGPVENRVEALSSIQPGLGVIMHEIGYRTSAMYWAANGGNWGLAQYELKELLEAQEVAELTRPNRAPMLKGFEEGNLEPLGKAISKKDIKLFNKRFEAAVNGCNACHTALGYGFIKYKVSGQPKHDVLDYGLKTEPKYEEGKEGK